MGGQNPDLAPALTNSPMSLLEAAKWHFAPFAPFTLFMADHLEPLEAAWEWRPPKGHWTLMEGKEEMGTAPLPPGVRPAWQSQTIRSSKSPSVSHESEAPFRACLGAVGLQGKAAGGPGLAWAVPRPGALSPHSMLSASYSCVTICPEIKTFHPAGEVNNPKTTSFKNSLKLTTFSRSLLDSVNNES